MQLKSLLGQQAVSAMEKYQLLEQRDKILRKCKKIVSFKVCCYLCNLKVLDRIKVSDVNQASVFRGTCTDMCPEKERYRREVQHLLYSFETLPHPYVGVDHSRAVKDYSRSSADQVS